MKAVILSGSPGTHRFPLANFHPKILLPLANKPSVAYTVEALGQCGIRDILIVGSASQGCDRAVIENLGSTDLATKVSYFEETEPLGTAGALRGLRAALGSSDILVLGANLICEVEQLSAILSFHHTQPGRATMVLEKVVGEHDSLETIEVNDDDEVLRIHDLHRSKDRRTSLRPSGLYILPSEALDLIPLEGHMDIKGQLIPALQSEGIQVKAYRVDKPLAKLDTIDDYVELNRACIALGGLRARPAKLVGSHEGDPEGIWVGENTVLSPDARLVGPLVIGDNCSIGANVELIGPTSIGDGSSIEEDAFVRETAVFANVRIGRAASVRYSVVAESSAVDSEEQIANAIVMNHEEGPDIYSLTRCDALRDQLPDEYATPFTRSRRHKIHERIYQVSKRLTDIVASAAGLLLLCPLWPIVALAIRLETPGPSIYRQTRCGIGGRPFTMYKLRTMFRDAHAEQEELAVHKQVDGPMFKMGDDPRITRVGRLVRRAGIDELPQLVNVLRGDMSLVGPRPLVMDEMQFAPGWRDIRLSVRPGVTGLWQISERDSVAFHSWISSDIQYVRERSFALDVSILLRTVLFSLRGSGV
jgi:lipopolysaccharide/colanic/teichoic acid biosynthesis glycosyltransferase/dTDP-glucose pyrophosphorylase